MKLCKCECGGEIIIRKVHKCPSVGIPRFIHGHNRRGKKNKTISTARFRECDICNKTFSYYETTYPNRRFCSRKCSSIAKKTERIGMKFTEEHCRNISKSHNGHKGYWTGKKRSAEDIEKFRKSHLGKKATEETKAKMSKTQKGKRIGKENYFYGKRLIGDQNNNWHGGKSFEPYTYHFNEKLKEEIRNRDNRLCQLCGKNELKNGKKLAIHHADYIKENCNRENLLALCNSCNNKVNFNRGFWTGFFVGYILSRNKFV